VAREGAFECPPEYADAVREALTRAGLTENQMGVWTREGRVSSSDNGARALPTANVATPPPAPQIPNSTLEEIVSSPGAVEPAKKDRAALLWKVEALEEKAFNLMEHREKVLSTVGESDEKAFASALSVGLDNRLGEFRNAVVTARENLDKTFSSFLDVVAKAKASEYFTTRLVELKQTLENSNGEMAERLEEISNRLKAFGADCSPQAVAAAIVRQLERMESNADDSRGANTAMQRALDAEATLEGAIEGLRLASQTRVDLHGQAKRQLGEMAGLSFVKEIHFRSNVLKARTTSAKLKYKWKVPGGAATHQRDIIIGEFEVSLKLHGDNPGVVLENLQFPNANRQHPHVSGAPARGQSICWGNISGDITKLLKEWDFATLLTLIWNFLNSYNFNDSYIQLKKLWMEWTKEVLPGEEVA